MQITLYNTATRTLEPFTHDKNAPVKLYTCGPTVYNYAHIGNLRTYIFEDTLRRLLEYAGYTVDHVMNSTDVGHLTSDADEGEDKLEKGAAREGKSVWDIAQFYTDAFLRDIAALHIERPTHFVPATQYVQKQMEMIQLLTDRGFTYQTDYAIYFDTGELVDYGKLTGQDFAQMQTGREEVVQDPGKKRQQDFALWFFLKGRYENHTMHWPSPWGEGFPGWHIECAAINWQFFPHGTDIHTGGIDHIPVHHTNEIAEYEAALGQPMARIWMHGNFLVLQKAEKMAKSGENFLTLQSLIDRGFDPLAYRYFCLQAHYRSELQFSWEALTAAQSALDTLYERLRDITATPAKSALDDMDAVIANAIGDDLNTAKALGLLWQVLNEDYEAAEIAYIITRIEPLLGLQLPDYLGKPVAVSDTVAEMARKRDQARATRNFPIADQLRQQIAEAGYTVEDTVNGPKFRKIRILQVPKAV